MSTAAILVIVWVHTIADFALQSDRMAINKSSSNRWLVLHVGIYAACLVPFGWQFALVNFAAHFVTDWVTSRITSKLWKAGERHWFFVVIGIDQALHFSALFLTYGWLVR